MWPRTLVTALLVMSMAGCTLLPKENDGTAALAYPEAQAHYQKGLSSYGAGRFDNALAELSAANASGRLKSADEVNARKHIAFIHCASGRELQCREQFQAILKADPKFDLAANEAGHPQWGPVWRSVKAAADEQRAAVRTGGILGMLTSPAQQKLAEGLKEFEVGRYTEALAALQAALKAGLPARADEIRARKYSAFAYCLAKQHKQCGAEFQQILAIDPKFELLPAEAGHPAWTPAYRRAKAAASQAGRTKAKR